MKGKRGRVPKEQHYVHESYMDAIVRREDFDEVQALFTRRAKNNQHTCQNQKVHRYAGLLKCGECGNGFTARRRRDGSGSFVRVAYNCTTYYRFGKGHCSSHSIHEAAIDEVVFGKLAALLRGGTLSIDEIERRIDEEASQPNPIQELRDKLEGRIAAKKEEFKDYARQVARRLIDEELFEELSGEAREEIARMERQLALCAVETRDPEEEKRLVHDCLERLEGIVSSRNLTQADIAMLIDHIDVHETGEIGAYGVAGLRLTVVWNIPEFGILEEAIDIA